MITADAFVAIEESLIKYVMGLIWPDVSPIFLKVDRALEGGDLDKARQELGTISLSELEGKAIGYVTYMTTVGMLFGASRVAQLPATSVVGMGFESETVNRMAKSFCQSITHKLEAYLKQIGEEKIHSTQKAERVLLPFASFMDDAGKAYLNMVSSLHTSRVSAYGFTAEAYALGIKQYQISEQLDGRTCPVCRALHGKKFPVDEARQTLDIVTRVTDPDELKALQPWPSQTKEDVAKLRAMSNDDLIQANWHIPPFHPRCRGMLVRSGKAPSLAQLDDGYVDTRYVATKEDFKAMKVYLNESQIKYWNEHVGMAPAEMVARLTGRPLDEFLAGLMDAEKPKEYAGIYSLTVNKNITIKLTMDGFGAANPFDQSVKILPKTKSLYLEAVDLHEEDQAAGVAKKYMREFYALAKDMGLKKLELYAGLDIGGYAWAKYGFAPDLKSWEALKRDIAARYKAVDYGSKLNPIEKRAYEAIMESTDPKDIFLLSDVKFGKDLLLGQGWQGALDLADAESVTRFLVYCGQVS